MTASATETTVLTDARDEDREAWIRKAVDQANVSVLRMALLQVTGDPELENLPVEEAPIRGGALIAYNVVAEYHPLIREKAAAWLLKQDDVIPPPPPVAEAERLIEQFVGQPLKRDEIDYAYEELAYADFPRDVQWTAGQKPERANAVRVLIVGAGISGIAAAVQFSRLGLRFRILDRNADLGGTWFVNDYPDARVDTSSYLYQFKFEKNYPWTEFFAAAGESRTYLNHIVDRFKLRDTMTFGVEVIRSVWDAERSLWTVTYRDSAGMEHVEEAEILVSAAGLFNKPKLPSIPGLESYKGPMFHTTEWRHDVDMAGKRVALIGTGSTGAQLAPIVAEEVEHLTIYQRTPEWVMAFEGYKVPITQEARWLFDNVPYYWNWFCLSSHMTGQSMQGLQYHDAEWQAKGGAISERNDRVRAVLQQYISDKVGGDPDLIARLTPNYAPLVRRLVVDNGFYDTIMRDNVDLVSGPIDRITETGVIGGDGVERQFDAIVLGTGFETAEYLWPVDYRGRDGANLADFWAKDGARSYLGITMPGFPNLFIFYGPNGSPRSGGFYSWAEIWARYIGQAIVHVIEHEHSKIEVSADVHHEYNARLDEGMKVTTWESEGASYYVNSFGRSGIFMPWETQEYHALVRNFNPKDFTCE